MSRLWFINLVWYTNILVTLTYYCLLDFQLKGQDILCPDHETIMTSLLTNRIPRTWMAESYPTTKSFSAWFADFDLRCQFFRQWANMSSDVMPILWISAFFSPKSLITACLQKELRRMYHISSGPLHLQRATLSSLAMIFKITDEYFSDCESLSPSNTKTLCYGIFLDQGYWDPEEKVLSDPIRGQIFSPMPMIVLHAVLLDDNCTNLDQYFQTWPTASLGSRNYVCPLYQSSSRRGGKSTSGLSSNHILYSPLPSKVPVQVWILRGTAMILENPALE